MGFICISAAHKIFTVFYPIYLSGSCFVVRAVRQKAKDLIEFVQDDDRVRDERRKAKKTKDKYIGMAAESLSHQYSM